MSLQTAFKDSLRHYTWLTMQRGWWAQAQHEITRLENGSALFKGLRQAVEANLKAAQFTPHADERGNWWVVLSAAEKNWPIFPSRSKSEEPTQAKSHQQNRSKTARRRA